MPHHIYCQLRDDQSDKMIHATTVAPEQTTVAADDTTLASKLHHVRFVRKNHTAEQLEKVSFFNSSHIRFVSFDHYIISWFGFVLFLKDYEKLDSGLTYTSHQHNVSLPVLSLLRKLDSKRSDPVVIIDGETYEIQEVHVLGNTKFTFVIKRNVFRLAKALLFFNQIKISHKVRSDDKGLTSIRLYID